MPQSLADKIPDVLAEVRTFLDRTDTPLAHLAREADISRCWLHNWLKEGGGDIRLCAARRLLRALDALQPRRGRGRRRPG